MIRKPISQKATIAYMLGAVVLIGLGYSWLSYRQKVFNPNDTTMPNLQQFIQGIKFSVVPNIQVVEFGGRAGEIGL